MSATVLDLDAAASLVDFLDLTVEERERLGAFLGAAVAEAVADFSTEMRVRRTYDAERAGGATRRDALEACGKRCGVSAATAERIIDGAWGRQPEARAVE